MTSAHRLYAVIRLCALALLVVCGTVHAAETSPEALGEAAYRRGDLTEAMRQFRIAGDAGVPSAQARLGEILDKAELDDEAVVWFRKAAAQGDPAGLYGLGQMHATGEGVPKSPSVALRHWNDAASRGHVLATLTLARTYETGWGDVAADPAKALGYWEKAAAMGDRSAVQKLAQIYRKGGLGVVPDPTRAAEWETRLAAGTKP